MRVVLLLSLLSAVACTQFPPMPDAGAPDATVPTGCQLGFIGSTSADPELTVTALFPGDIQRDLQDGDPIPLMFPPQGGRVVFAGVRVNNMHACGAELSGALRDPNNNLVRVDARTFNLRRLDGGMGGSVVTNITTFANIPVCPNQWSTQDVFDGGYLLEMRVTDRNGRTAERTLTVRPYCAEPEREAECRCICQKDYVLGQSCDTDGGMAMDGGS